MEGSFRFSRSELDAYLKRERGYSLNEFDETFSPIWPYPLDWLYALTALESGFEPTAGNNVAIGLFGQIKKFYPAANRNALLSSHRESLRQAVTHFKRQSFRSFLDLYLYHFLPASFSYMRQNVNSRFACFPQKKGRFASARLQYAALLQSQSNPELVAPVIDVFEFLTTLRKWCAQADIPLMIQPFIREFSLAGENSKYSLAGWKVLSKSDLASATEYAQALFHLEEEWVLLPGSSSRDYWAPYASVGSTRALLSEQIERLGAPVTTFSQDGADDIDPQSLFPGEDVEVLSRAHFSLLLYPTISAGGSQLELFSIATVSSTHNATEMLVEGLSRSLLLTRRLLADGNELLLDLAPVEGGRIGFGLITPEYTSAMSLATCREFRDRYDAPTVVQNAVLKIARQPEFYQNVGLVGVNAYPALLGTDLSVYTPSLLAGKVLMHGLYTVRGSGDERLHHTLWHHDLMFPLSLPLVPIDFKWSDRYKHYFEFSSSDMLQIPEIREALDAVLVWASEIETMGRRNLVLSTVQAYLDYAISIQPVVKKRLPNALLNPAELRETIGFLTLNFSLDR